MDTDNNTETLDEIALNPDHFFFGEVEILQTLGHEMCHQWQHHHGSPSRSGYHNRQWAEMMEKIGLMPSSTGRPGGKKTGQKMGDYVIQNGIFIQVANDLIAKHHPIVQWEYLSWESHRLQQIFCISDNQLQVDTSLVNDLKPGTFITVGQTTAIVDKIDTDNSIVDYHQVSGPETFAEMVEELGEENLEAFVKVPLHKPKNETRVKYTCPNCEINVWGKPKIKIICGECELSLLTY